MNKQCNAFLAIKKNRMKSYAIRENSLKPYGPETYYLKDGQEFELGLANYTKSTVAAAIHMNGKAISKSVIILKPGQTVFLERFIDENKKFLFETYKVDGSSEAQKAIEDNGNIEIKFYKEKEIPVYNTSIIVGTSGDWASTYFNSTGNTNLFNTTTASSYGGQHVNNVSRGLKRKASLSVDNDMCMSFTEEVETGRVEKGGASNQRFETYMGEFETWAFETVNIKLLPISQKPLTISDLATYCTNCGTKNKKGNYRFCPKCGTKY